MELDKAIKLKSYLGLGRAKDRKSWHLNKDPKIIQNS